MVRIIEGDLMNAQCDIIAHQVNCQGAFNSGVAKAIRDCEGHYSNLKEKTVEYMREFAKKYNIDPAIVRIIFKKMKGGANW